MPKIAVLVDLSFFLNRYRALRHPKGQSMLAEAVAKAVWDTAKAHAREKRDELYRILVYDCRPLAKKAHNPVTKRAVDFSKTDTFRFRSDLHAKLVCLRKVALRLGELQDRRAWVIRPAATKKLLDREQTIEQLGEADVLYDVRQKGVDIKIGIDMASLAYKRLVDCLVLITGDSDFVPAEKLARREGLDVILDPLWAPIAPSLNEHIDGLKTRWPRPNIASDAQNTSSE